MSKAANPKSDNFLCNIYWIPALPPILVTLWHGIGCLGRTSGDDKLWNARTGLPEQLAVVPSSQDACNVRYEAGSPEEDCVSWTATSTLNYYLRYLVEYKMGSTMPRVQQNPWCQPTDATMEATVGDAYR